MRSGAHHSIIAISFLPLLAGCFIDWHQYGAGLDAGVERRDDAAPAPDSKIQDAALPDATNLPDAARDAEEREVVTQDAGNVDAGAPGLCGQPAAGQTPGDDCAGSVGCARAGLCDVNQFICCTSFTGQVDECITATSCSFDKHHIRCDGPEDCAQGQLCCFEADETTACRDTCAPQDQVCHTDDHCTENRCVEGRPDPSPWFDTLYKYLGFCRGD